MNITINSIPLADLEVVAVSYLADHDEETGAPIYDLDILNETLRDSADFTASRGDRCDCCGSTRLKYACEVVHRPTGRGYYIGRDCAAKIDTLQSSANRIGHSTINLANRAKARREAVKHAKRIADWVIANPAHAEVVAWAQSDAGHHIAKDIVSNFGKRGSISKAQVQLLHRLKAQIEERAAAAAAEPQPTGPAPEGRLEVTVTVLGTKEIENRFSDYGGTITKALVRLDGYNTKAWVTSAGLVRGERAVIRATFQRSDRDEHFAFGSRPKVIEVLERGAAHLYAEG